MSKKAPKGTKIPVPVHQLFLKLEYNLTKLHDHAARAFTKNEEAYLGEVAGKVRLLACKTPSNKPLLIELMATTGIELLVFTDRPPNMRGPDGQPLSTRRTLEKYMDEHCMSLRVSDGPPPRMASATHRDFALAWAQQDGASHVDSSVDELLWHALRARNYVGGVQIAVKILHGISRTVHMVGTDFCRLYREKYGESGFPEPPQPGPAPRRL